MMIDTSSRDTTASPMDVTEEEWRKYFTPVVSSRLHRPHSISFTPAPAGSPLSQQCWDPQSQQSPPHRCEGEHRCNHEGINRIDSNFFPNDSPPIVSVIPDTPESQTFTPQPQSPVAKANETQANDNEPEANETEPESSVTEPASNDNDNELRKFIKNILKKHEDIFNRKLDEQSKIHTR